MSNSFDVKTIEQLETLKEIDRIARTLVEQVPADGFHRKSWPMDLSRTLISLANNLDALHHFTYAAGGGTKLQEQPTTLEERHRLWAVNDLCSTLITQSAAHLRAERSRTNATRWVREQQKTLTALRGIYAAK